MYHRLVCLTTVVGIVFFKKKNNEDVESVSISYRNKGPHVPSDVHGLRTKPLTRFHRARHPCIGVHLECGICRFVHYTSQREMTLSLHGMVFLERSPQAENQWRKKASRSLRVSAVHLHGMWSFLDPQFWPLFITQTDTLTTIDSFKRQENSLGTGLLFYPGAHLNRTRKSAEPGIQIPKDLCRNLSPGNRALFEN